MGIINLGKKIDTLSRQFSFLLSKTSDCRAREELFKTYYDVILLIQNLHLDYIRAQLKKGKKQYITHIVKEV